MSFRCDVMNMLLESDYFQYRPYKMYNGGITGVPEAFQNPNVYWVFPEDSNKYYLADYNESLDEMLLVAYYYNGVSKLAKSKRLSRAEFIKIIQDSQQQALKVMKNNGLPTISSWVVPIGDSSNTSKYTVVGIDDNNGIIMSPGANGELLSYDITTLKDIFENISENFSLAQKKLLTDSIQQNIYARVSDDLSTDAFLAREIATHIFDKKEFFLYDNSPKGSGISGNFVISSFVVDENNKIASFEKVKIKKSKSKKEYVISLQQLALGVVDGINHNLEGDAEFAKTARKMYPAKKAKQTTSEHDRIKGEIENGKYIKVSGGSFYGLPYIYGLFNSNGVAMSALKDKYSIPPFEDYMIVEVNKYGVKLESKLANKTVIVPYDELKELGAETTTSEEPQVDSDKQNATGDDSIEAQSEIEKFLDSHQIDKDILKKEFYWGDSKNRYSIVDFIDEELPGIILKGVNTGKIYKFPLYDLETYVLDNPRNKALL